MKDYAILIDTTFCTGCNTCTYRCVQEFREHEIAARGLFRNFVQLKDEGFYEQRCLHCKEPQCVKACPSGALTQSSYGPVLYDAAKCQGDKKCVAACAFHAIQFDEAKKKIVKCNFCAHRVSADKPPACVEVCPSGALQFGEYSALVARANALAEKGKLKIYGLKENGGTHVIILTKANPAVLGYPNVGKRKVQTAAVAGELTTLPLVAGAVYAGLQKLNERKTSVELSESGKHAE